MKRERVFFNNHSISGSHFPKQSKTSTGIECRRAKSFGIMVLFGFPRRGNLKNRRWHRDVRLGFQVGKPLVAGLAEPKDIFDDMEDVLDLFADVELLAFQLSEPVDAKGFLPRRTCVKAPACWFGSPLKTDADRPAQPCACVQHGGANQSIACRARR